MRKLLLAISVVLLSAASAMAEYNYLELRSTDGLSQTIETSGLVIVKDGDNLTATNTAGSSLTVELSSLDFMQFSDSSEVKVILTGNGPLDVFTLEGVKAGRFDSLEECMDELAPGVYIVKDSKNGSLKIRISR